MIFVNSIKVHDKSFTQNKTSMQWTPGSQIYLSSKKMRFWSKMIFEQKKSKSAYIMHTLCLIIFATNTTFSDLIRITLLKLHVKLQPHPFKIF